MRLGRLLCCCACLTVAITRSSALATDADAAPVTLPVRVYLTTADLSSALARQPDLSLAPLASVPATTHNVGGVGQGVSTRVITTTIVVTPSVTYQQIDGFGGAMTDSSAWLLFTKLAPTARDAVMRDLFDPVHGVGISFLRVPIGASDFTADGLPYTYDDVPVGASDPGLDGFSITHDLTYVVPALQEASRLNPQLKLVASPWSPPGWMKTGQPGPFAGTISPAAFGPLARYFVRFLQAYQAQGIPIYALTPQNEPGQAADGPAVAFPAQQEAAFIGGYLGPALAQASLHPRILAYDSQWRTVDTTPNYPSIVLNDPAAQPYLAGTAWHCYLGSPDVMAQIHQVYPQRDNYVTECASGISHGDVAELIIASSRNWSRGALLWNLALDTQGGPKEGDWCQHCTAPVRINQNTGAYTYTRDYYQLGQASAFVRPGAYRIASSSPVTGYSENGLGCASTVSYGVSTVDDVAFKNPDGSIALLAFNDARGGRLLDVRVGGVGFTYMLPSCATATFVWGAPTPAAATPTPTPVPAPPTPRPPHQE